MLKVILILLSIFFFISTLVVGFLLYRFENKKRYSLLNSFPFEIKPKQYSYVFISLLILTISFLCADSLYLLYFNNASSFLTKVLSLLLIFNIILLIILFNVNFKSLNNHLLMSSIFTSVTFLSYILFIYISVINKFEVFQLYQTIIASFISLILFSIIVIPNLSNWYKAKLIKDEKGNEIFVRGKVNILTILEWLSVIFLVLLIVLISLTPCL